MAAWHNVQALTYERLVARDKLNPVDEDRWRKLGLMHRQMAKVILDDQST